MTAPWRQHCTRFVFREHVCLNILGWPKTLLCQGQQQKSKSPNLLHPTHCTVTQLYKMTHLSSFSLRDILRLSASDNFLVTSLETASSRFWATLEDHERKVVIISSHWEMGKHKSAHDEVSICIINTFPSFVLCCTLLASEKFKCRALLNDIIALWFSDVDKIWPSIEVQMGQMQQGVDLSYLCLRTNLTFL